MEGIQLEERKALGALLDTQSQESVMARIPQFHTAETDNFVEPPKTVPEALGVLMFNMERGVNLEENFSGTVRTSSPLISSLPTNWMTAAHGPATRTPPGSWQRPLA